MDDEQQQRVPAYFSTPVQDIDMANPLDLDTVIANLSSQVQHWNARGSGFVVDVIKKFVIVICKYRPLQGSSWLETPSGWLRREQRSTSRTLLTGTVHPLLHSSCPISSRANFQLPPTSKHPQRFRSHILYFQCPSKISPNLNTRTHPSA